MKLLRSSEFDLKTAPRDVNDKAVTQIVQLLNRETDYDQVLDEIVNRYARAIVKIHDNNTGTSSDQLVKVNSAVETAIREGFYEVLPLRWLPRICHESATLYTEPGLSYEYSIGDQPHDTTQTIIETMREDGGDELVMPVVDLQAFGVGTCGEYIAFESNRLRYQAAPLNSLFVAFADHIYEVDGTKKKQRATNTTRLEEASVVVLRMGSTADGKGSYYAWYGACKRYPNGRHVRFVSDSWRNVPDPGKGGYDYTTAGEFVEKPVESELANPLTLWVNSYGGEDSPEYPIALFYEDALHQSSKILRCTGYSRMKTNLEFDVGASRLLSSTLKAARGVFALTNSKNQPLPQGWDEGMIQLFRDQLLAVYNVPGVNSKYAFDIVARSMRLAAESEGVAGYLVDADGAMEASGISLKVQNHPMIRRRMQRIKANKPGQRAKFNIERALLNSANGSATGVIPLEVRETWHPGERSFPEDATEVRENAIALYDGGHITRVELTKRTENLAKAKEAKAFIQKMEDDAAENPELYGFKTAAPAGPVKVGLRDRVKQLIPGGKVNGGQEAKQEAGGDGGKGQPGNVPPRVLGQPAGKPAA